MDIYELATKPIEKISSEFKTDIFKGLSNREVNLRLKKYGYNELSGNVINWWNILLRQFTSPFIYLLIGASILAFLFGEIFDGLMILLFLAINTALGFYQEFRSEKTLSLLKSYVTSYSRVLRNGKEEIIKRKELVPGDIVILEIGDKIPADVRFVDAYNLKVDESILTGESVPIEKNEEPLPSKPKELYKSSNIGFSGTAVVCGEAKGIVIATGGATALGNIAHLTVETKHISNFEKGISKFSGFILKLVLITLAFVFFINIFLKGTTKIGELIIFSIALAVSVIPEALPVVTTFSLSRGALHLAKRRVVVRRLSAIEDLGGIEILCTDKTGTITENKLKVDDFFTESSSKIFFYANLADSSASKKKIEPFDIALAEKLSSKEKEEIKLYSRIGEIPFDPVRRRNAAFIEKEGKYELVVRGAPESIIPLCSHISLSEKNKIYEWIAEKGRDGHRVIAIGKKEVDISSLEKDNQENNLFSYRKDKSLDLDVNLAKYENKIELLGIISFVDPIKISAFQAIKQAKDLGICVKVLTGDSKEVAGSVAHQVGLVSSPNDVITGEEFKVMNINEQLKAIDKYSAFARVTPEQKYNIIQLLQRKNSVGFLGEGINDVPALKAAGVSIVVQSASDIARGTADIVLLEKDLKVIIDGIEEGRKVFANTIKYIKATLASNFGNFYAVAISSLFIDFLPMLPLQILLLNLLSDFPMIAISTDNVDKSEISEPKKYNLREVAFIATLLGIVSTVFDFIFFGLFYRISPAILQTNWFIGSILTELVFLFSIRTHFFFIKGKKPSSIMLYLTSMAAFLTIILPFTSFGRNIFHFVPPSLYSLVLIFGIVILYFISSEAVKILYYRNFTYKQKLNET